MVEVDFALTGLGVDLRVGGLTGYERLGEASTFELELGVHEPLETEGLVGTPCAIRLRSELGERVVAGVLTRITAVATSQASPARKLRVSVRAQLAMLELRRQTRVFQHQTVPEIIEAVLARGAYAADRIDKTLSGTHDAREYVVQYAETDAAFVRRLCEDDGLWFRFGADDDGERFLLEDTSASAPEAAAPWRFSTTPWRPRRLPPSAAWSPGAAGPAR